MATETENQIAERVSRAFCDAVADQGPEGSYRTVAEAIKAEFDPAEYSDLLGVVLPLAAKELTGTVLEMMAPEPSIADFIDELFGPEAAALFR